MPETFAIVCASNVTLAIQAGATGGSGVTLQNFDSSNLLQVWQIAMQVGGGYLGIAFINPATGNSVTYNGDRAQLVMQSYSPNSGDRDSWSILGTGQLNNFRIALPADNGWSWNDFGGNFQPGDVIGLWDDTSSNSVWTVVLL